MKLKVLFLTFLFTALAWGQTTVTYSFSASGAVTGLNEATPGIALDTNIGFGSFKNSGTSNPALNSGQLRLYQNATKGGSIKIYASNGVTITDVVVNASSRTGDAAFIVDGGTATNLTGGTTYTMSSLSATSEVEFHQKESGSSNRIYVDSFSVTYTSSPSPPAITSSLTDSGTVGTAYTYNITATNSPTSYNATGLPAGLSINTSTGEITGTVSTAGSYNVAITATNTYGNDTQTLAITFTTGPCLSDNFNTSTSDYGNWNGSGTYINTTAGLSGYGVGFNSKNDKIITDDYVTNPQSLTLQLRRTSSTANKKLSVQYSTSSTGPWTTASDITVGSVTTTHQLFTVPLNLTGNYYLKIEMTQRSGGSYYLDDVNVFCGATTPADIVLSSNNPSVAASTITQNVDNHVIYAFNLSVSSANATLNDVVFTTSTGYAASNITNFKLWYSTDNTFDSASDTSLDNLTSSLGAGSHNFTGFSQVINDGTMGYFFITTDIPCSATVGNNFSVSAITTSDLTFASGNKTGTAFNSGLHTIAGANPNNITDLTTANCENGTATVSWTNPTGCYNNVLVFVSDTPFSTTIPTGNGAAYIASTNFGSGTAFDGGYTAYKGTGNSVTITGLTNGTTYYYKVFTRNGLLWSNGVTTNCTPAMVYCSSGATGLSDSEIEKVTLVGENNSINNDTTDSCTTGVNDYTAMNADLQIGGTYTATVEFGDCDGGSWYNGAGGVWIDWNNDGDFDDTNETIYTGDLSFSGANITQTITISVPVTQTVGFYRMRIVQEEGGTASTISPCGTFSFGSTEDYSIEIINACTSTATITSITPTTGPVGTTITINGSGFTTASTISFGTISTTFTVISDTVIETVVPTGASSGNIIIQDTGGCKLPYSSFTVITTDNSSCEGGASTTTGLIIYDIHDEYSGSGGFITIYNGTGATVDLTNYSIWRAGDYGGTYSNYATTSGTIASGALGILKVSSGSCGPASTNGTISNGFNENDGLQLRNADGSVIIDDVHTYTASKGYYMVRNAGAYTARTTYNASDWSITPLIAGQCWPSAGMVLPPSNGDSPDVTLNPVDVTVDCNSSSSSIAASLSVAGTEGVAGGLNLAYQWYVNSPGNTGWVTINNGGVYSGATSATLSISSTNGLNNYQYYCQIRENTPTCFTATEAAIIKDEVTIWNGSSWSNGTPNATKRMIIDSNYNTSVNGSFECCSLFITTGNTLTVKANDYVEVQNNVTVNGTFTIENNGSLVQINDNATNTGNISYERTTTGTALDYVYWSAPTESATTPSSGAIYKWNPTVANTNGGYGNWETALNESMIAGKGYIMRDVFSTTFTGTPRNGILTPTIAKGTYTGIDYAGTNGETVTAIDDNWNLVGNPYPSAIDAIDFLTLNSNLNGFIQIWTHGTSPSTATVSPFYGTYTSNYTANDYITYNATGTSTPSGFNGKIAAGQGFMVNIDDDTNVATTGTVTFNNSLRNKTHNNSQFYRGASTSNKHRIWLDIVSPDNKTGRTLVGYVSGATNSKDRMYDAITAPGTETGIYSILGTDRMVIQGRELPFDATDRIPLGVHTPQQGNYTIAIYNVDGLFETANQTIYLEDKELNSIHNLTNAPYVFFSNSGEFLTRFVLRFTDNSLSSDEFAALENSVWVSTTTSLTIHSSKETIKSVRVYTILGQEIFYKNSINKNEVTIPEITTSTTPLLVQIQLNNDVIISKKIISNR